MVIPLIIGAASLVDLGIFALTGKDTLQHVTGFINHDEGFDLWGTVLGYIPGFNDSSSSSGSEVSSMDPIVFVVLGLGVLLLYLLFKKRKNKNKGVKY